MNTSIPPQYCRECGVELTPETGSLKRPGQYRLDCKQCRNNKWRVEHPSSRRRATGFCLTCGVELTEENCDEKSSGRKFPDCNECRNAQRRQRRTNNPEHYRTYEAQRYQDNKEYISEQRVQQRRKKGIPPPHRNPMPDGYTGSRKQWYYDTHPGTYEKHQDYLSQLKHQRRAIGYGAGIDFVDYAYVRQRDGMFCYLCHQDILPDQETNYDHVWPLSRGGPHNEDNIKVTHKICNLRKHNKFVSELTEHDRRGL